MTAFYIALVLWVIIFIIYIVYLYLNNSKPYLNQLKEKYTKIPEQLDPAQLSLLMHNKLIPEVISSTLLFLIKNGKLVLEKEDDETYICLSNSNFKTSKSQNYLIEIFIDTMGNGERVSINQIYNYCSNNRNSSNFLNDYQLWRKLVLGELTNLDYYLPKTIFQEVRFLKNTGMVLFILNNVLSYHFVLGYVILIPSFFSMFYFKQIFKRTIRGNNEYCKWLSYKTYLNNQLKRKVNNKDLWELYIYGLILNVDLDNYLNLENKEFVIELNNAVKRCLIRSKLHGNRSFFLQ